VGWAWWDRAVIAALGKLMEEDSQLDSSLGCTRYCLKKKPRQVADCRFLFYILSDLHVISVRGRYKDFRVKGIWF
jgi:hypothetical protein